MFARRSLICRRRRHQAWSDCQEKPPSRGGLRDREAEGLFDYSLKVGNDLSTCPSFNEQINSLRKIKSPERTIKTSMFSDRSTQNPTGCLRQGRRCVATSDSLFAVACLPTPPYPHTTPPSLLLF